MTGRRVFYILFGFVLLAGLLAGVSISVAAGPGQPAPADAPLNGGITREIAVGDQFACGLKLDGSLICWGDNNYGQATPPDGAGFKQVAANYSNACAIKSDNSVVCWGSDGSGVVSDVPAGAFVQVTVGGNHACGLRTNGIAACWGNDSKGQVTNVPTYTLSQLDSGSDHICALKTADGKPVCWGDNFYGEANPPDEAFAQIVAANNHSCGRRADGSVTCWGESTNGQLAVPAGATFTQISAGNYHTCGVQTDGTLACWGQDSAGQSSGKPAGTFRVVNAGVHGTCALRSNDKLDCWGWVDGSQLPAQVLPQSLPKAYTDLVYDRQLTLRYGTAPYHFAITAGDVPPGMDLSETGKLTGQPTATGVYTFTVEATDAGVAFPFQQSQVVRLTVGQTGTKLGLSVKDEVDPIRAGWIIRYTIRVTNTSASALPLITVTDTLPANTRFVTADGGGVRNGNRVIWRLRNVPAGGVRELHVSVATFSTYRGYLTNQARAEANGVSVTKTEFTKVVGPAGAPAEADAPPLEDAEAPAAE